MRIAAPCGGRRPPSEVSHEPCSSLRRSGRSPAAAASAVAELRNAANTVAEIQNQANFCEGTYALCIKAHCTGIPTLDRLGNYTIDRALCECDVVQGVSMGPAPARTARW